MLMSGPKIGWLRQSEQDGFSFSFMGPMLIPHQLFITFTESKKTVLIKKI